MTQNTWFNKYRIVVKGFTSKDKVKHCCLYAVSVSVDWLFIASFSTRQYYLSNFAFEFRSENPCSHWIFNAGSKCSTRNILSWGNEAVCHARTVEVSQDCGRCRTVVMALLRMWAVDLYFLPDAKVWQDCVLVQNSHIPPPERLSRRKTQYESKKTAVFAISSRV